MSGQSDNSATAEVVNIVRLIDHSARKRIVTVTDTSRGAQLLSIRKSLRYRATIGLTDLDAFKSNYSSKQLASTMLQIRQLLDIEFGSLRVHRYRQCFTVGQPCLESLIGGLLRVQYLARQIELPVAERVTGDDDAVVQLTWGVGDSVIEADNERLRRSGVKLP